MSIARKIADRLDNSGELRSYSNVDAITGNAVDIFIYDTSKDSDGGAWRKRTQHTSWYNEAASTTRGSRKDFPAVAVIVVDDVNVTIYDGDTPDLDMWWSIPTGVGDGYSFKRNSVVAKNGQVVTGMYQTTASQPNGYGGVLTMDFVGDRAIKYAGDVACCSGYGYFNDIRFRGSFQYQFRSENVMRLVSGWVNDVAITVLPNAPIDSTTGLPTPTIAVATDGGVSVIKDDGTVGNGLTDSQSLPIRSVNFDDTELLWAITGMGGSAQSLAFIHKDDYTSTIPEVKNNTNERTGMYDYNLYPRISEYINNTSTYGLPVAYGNSKVAMHGHGGRHTRSTNGFTILDHNPTGMNYYGNRGNEYPSSSVVHITKKFNTGYMTGDIRGAWNVDSDVTSLDGTDRITNGDFGSSTTGWTLQNSDANGGTHANEAPYVSSGQLIMGNTGYVAQTLSNPAGLHVIAWNQVNANENSACRIGVYVNGTLVYDIVDSDGVRSFTYPLIANSPVQFRVRGAGWVTIDDISVRLAIPDRASTGQVYNGNGLAVHGTPTVSAVATGAELKCISGFTASNYLKQPYNSDLNFGTGDFSFSGWVKPDAISNRYLFQREGAETGSNILFLPRYSSGILFNVAGTYSTSGTTALQVDKWHNFFVGREGAVVKIYIDGELVSTASGSTTNLSSTNATLTVGNRKALTSHYEGSLALFRVSKTFATAEQIKEIYEAEKPMFQENAKCTLNGTSDAVTAMSYDDSNEELLVGTSGGLSVFKGLRRVDENTNNITEVAQQGSLRVEEY
jgi:hypothetical protein